MSTVPSPRATPRGAALRRWLRPSIVLPVIAAATAFFLVLAALVPGWLAPTDPLAIDPSAAFSSPSLAHWLGTDESGRDMYSRIVHGSRPSLLIGAAATGLGLGLALLLGLASGLGGRWLDAGIGRIVEVMLALPGLLLALVFIALAGPGVSTTIIAVGLTTAPGYARIIRSQARSLRGSAMIEAARVLGHHPARILFRHLLPNALGPVLVLATLGVGQAVIWASALSFLGLGEAPPAPEWGAMLAAGRTYLSSAWWMTFFPGLAIVATAAASTVLGRSLQRRAVGA